MATLAAYPEPMNVIDFQAFARLRPDGEKWELLDGELFMNASPVRPHQRVATNIIFALEQTRRATRAAFEVYAGIGVQLSDISVVEPDLGATLSLAQIYEDMDVIGPSA